MPVSMLIWFVVIGLVFKQKCVYKITLKSYRFFFKILYVFIFLVTRYNSCTEEWRLEIKQTTAPVAKKKKKWFTKNCWVKGKISRSFEELFVFLSFLWSLWGSFWGHGSFRLIVSWIDYILLLLFFFSKLVFLVVGRKDIGIFISFPLSLFLVK